MASPRGGVGAVGGALHGGRPYADRRAMPFEAFSWGIHSGAEWHEQPDISSGQPHGPHEPHHAGPGGDARTA